MRRCSMFWSSRNNASDPVWLDWNVNKSSILWCHRVLSSSGWGVASKWWWWWCEGAETLTQTETYSDMFTVSLQSAEEIDQLTVDEDLNDIERAVYLLRWAVTSLTLKPAEFIFVTFLWWFVSWIQTHCPVTNTVMSKYSPNQGATCSANQGPVCWWGR